MPRRVTIPDVNAAPYVFAAAAANPRGAMRAGSALGKLFVILALGAMAFLWLGAKTGWIETFAQDHGAPVGICEQERLARWHPDQPLSPLCAPQLVQP